jgi:Flp pilus assembly protein TadD
MHTDARHTHRWRIASPVAALIALGLSALLVGACDEDKPLIPPEALRATPPASRTAAASEAALPGTPRTDSGSETRRSSPGSISRPEPPVRSAVHEVTYSEAEVAYREGRYDEAFELFAAYTASKSENPWGHYMLGLSAWKAGLTEEAEAAFERALSLDPLHVKSMVNLSRVLLDLGEPGQADEVIARALELDPGSNAVLRVRGRVKHELGDFDAAVNSYRRAILLDGRDAWSMNNMGLVLIQDGRYEEALGPLARAVELLQDVAVFQNNLGVALERSGYVAASAEAFRSALALDGSYQKAAASLERVEGLLESSDLGAVDLTAFARGFEAQVERWREVASDEVTSESRNPESAVLPSDTIRD